MRDNATRTPVLTSDQLLAHWQGHRRLTRRLIEAYPEDRLYTHALGGMRTAGDLMGELVRMAAPTLRGVITDEWPVPAEAPTSRSELLAAWDATTEEIDATWSAIPPERFQEVMTAFGTWTMSGIDMILYIVDNEIHHRGQCYVYLRSLGVEPPAFYER